MHSAEGGDGLSERSPSLQSAQGRDGLDVQISSRSSSEIDIIDSELGATGPGIKRDNLTHENAQSQNPELSTARVMSRDTSSKESVAKQDETLDEPADDFDLNHKEKADAEQAEFSGDSRILQALNSSRKAFAQAKLSATMIEHSDPISRNSSQDGSSLSKIAATDEHDKPGTSRIEDIEEVDENSASLPQSDEASYQPNKDGQENSAKESEQGLEESITKAEMQPKEQSQYQSPRYAGKNVSSQVLWDILPPSSYSPRFRKQVHGLVFGCFARFWILSTWLCLPWTSYCNSYDRSCDKTSFVITWTVEE